MAKAASRQASRLPGVRGYRGRGAAYAYVRDNLERLVEKGVGTADGPTWSGFADYLARRRVVNKRGGRLSADSARKIFGRVQRDVEASAREAATGIPRGKRHPPQMPASWGPPSIAAPNPTSQGVQARPRTGEERIAAFRRLLAERSGL